MANRISQVGLFAGIVSAFIIDARSDLQIDSEQSLLKDIRDALQGSSIPKPVPISSSVRAVNILWFLSLLITLFTAVVAVLAKRWLTEYAPGHTRPRDAKAARRRFRLDKDAELVEIVITLVPLVFQTYLASFCFLVGLVIRTFGDDHAVGWSLLAFLLVGGTVYAASHLLPIFFPSSPFNTPHSSICEQLKEMVSASRSRQDDQDDNKVHLKILCKMFKSLTSEHVEEAAAEIVRPSFARNDEWLGYLCEQDIPSYLLSRIKHWASTRKGTQDERNVILRNHLHAFIEFAHYFRNKLLDRKATDDTRSDFLTLHPNLLHTFTELLNPTHHIYQSTSLDEGLAPLLFGLRVQVLIVLPRVPPRYQSKTEYTSSSFEFRPVKMSQSDRPLSWELALWELHSQDRFYLMLSSCRGVLQGQGKLKETSLSILSLRLAKGVYVESAVLCNSPHTVLAQAGYLMMEAGCMSDWSTSLMELQDKAESLVQEFLHKFFKAVGQYLMPTKFTNNPDNILSCRMA